MLAFKIMNNPFVGLLTFARIHSGKIEASTGVCNVVKEKGERIGCMLLMHSNNREEIKEAFAGNIVALVGMKDATTGDALCDPNKPVILERMEFPEPVIEIVIKPNTKANQENDIGWDVGGECLAVALSRRWWGFGLHRDVPVGPVSVGLETGDLV